MATKRALRAILKATDFCAAEPERGRPHWSRTKATRTTIALQTMKEIPYARWRDYDPEDTVRFYSLRLREAGMIKSSPSKIIAAGHRLAFLQRAQARAEGLTMRTALVLAFVDVAVLLLRWHAHRALSRDARPQSRRCRRSPRRRNSR